MSFATLKTTLNIRLGDTNNFTFTSEEKDEALTEAYNDDLVISEVWDNSLTFDVSIFQYAKPTTIDRLMDIYIRRSNASDTEPEKISSNLWEVVATNIQFKNGADAIIPGGYTLYLKGKNKYTTADTITETNVQEYVLNLAQLNCLNMLGVKKALSFLKNDTSISEIVAIKRELERKVMQYRQRLPRSFEVA
jgi:hypothetical protein